MPSLACIVEGQGDVASIPIVVRRIAFELGIHGLKILGPFRTHRYSIVRPGELERAVERAARSLPGDGGILIVLDADDDVPCDLGPSLANRATRARSDVRSGVVVANREKEAWYLAALESLWGKRDLPPGLLPPDAPEAVRGAKGWLARAMGRPYSEVTDQAALAALFDLGQARKKSRSFDKLWREVSRLLS